MKKQLLVDGMTVADLIEFHRARFGDVRMEVEQSAGASPPEAGTGGEQGLAQTFTQSDMDDLAKKVRAEERRKAAEKFADYDDLKAQAGEKATAEERIAALEKQNADLARDRMVARIQAAHGISDEDAELFLTGADEEALNRQAERLAQHSEDRKKQGNRSPREGENKRPDGDLDPMREFTRELFASAEGD